MTEKAERLMPSPLVEVVDVMIELSPPFRSEVAPPKMKPFEVTFESELMAKPMLLIVERSEEVIT